MLAPIAQGGKGQVVTITTPFAGVHDPATGTVSTGSATTQTGSGVEEAYSSFSVDGERVRASDKKFLLSPLNSAGAAITAPVADRDTLTLADASIWTIKKVDALKPAGMAVMYTLQLRGV